VRKVDIIMRVSNVLASLPPSSKLLLLFEEFSLAWVKACFQALWLHS
jgi:hypothetical protein